MSTCEQCGIEVPTMSQVVKVRFGVPHYFCSEAHAQETLEKPAAVKAEDLPPLEDAPRPAAKRRGRPPGAKNKPKA